MRVPLVPGRAATSPGRLPRRGCSLLRPMPPPLQWRTRTRARARTDGFTSRVTALPTHRCAELEQQCESHMRVEEDLVERVKMLEFALAQVRCPARACAKHGTRCNQGTRCAPAHTLTCTHVRVHTHRKDEREVWAGPAGSVPLSLGRSLARSLPPRPLSHSSWPPAPALSPCFPDPLPLTLSPRHNIFTHTHTLAHTRTRTEEQDREGNERAHSQGEAPARRAATRGSALSGFDHGS